MGQLTEFFMKSAGGPPPGMGFSMPMMKGWVPRHVQPWLYVLTALCFQFSGGIYLGALDGIRGTTNFMIALWFCHRSCHMQCADDALPVDACAHDSVLHSRNG